MTTIKSVQHFGGRLVVRDVATTDSASAAFGRFGRYYGTPIETLASAAPREAATEDSPRGNAMTAAEMNRRNREFYKRR